MARYGLLVLKVPLNPNQPTLRVQLSQYSNLVTAVVSTNIRAFEYDCACKISGVISLAVSDNTHLKRPNKM